MFEAMIVLCASLADGPCRAHLLPGYEAQTEAGCRSALDARAPDLEVFTGLVAQSAPACQPVGEALSVTEVAPGVFAHLGAIEEPNPDNRGDVSNVGFIVGEQSVAVIDTGTARWMGEALWRSIRQQTDKPVSHVLITHMHPDHSFGTGPFEEAGARIIGHQHLARSLSDRHVNYRESLDRLVGADVMLGTRPVPVDISIGLTSDIDLGGRRLTLQAWPMAHTGCDLTVLDHKTATLFAGDLVFEQHTPALDGNLIGWRAILAEMQALDVARVIPGHGGPALDWPQGAAPIMRYLKVLEEDTRAAINAGQRLGEAVEVIAQSEAPHWQLFDAYNQRNATVAFTEIEWE